VETVVFQIFQVTCCITPSPQPGPPWITHSPLLGPQWKQQANALKRKSCDFPPPLSEKSSQRHSGLGLQIGNRSGSSYDKNDVPLLAQKLYFTGRLVLWKETTTLCPGGIQSQLHLLAQKQYFYILSSFIFGRHVVPEINACLVWHFKCPVNNMLFSMNVRNFIIYV
jgi:hypothetical protein